MQLTKRPILHKIFCIFLSCARLQLYATIKGEVIEVAAAGNTEYKNKWLAEKRDRINLVVDKGKSQLIKQHASDRGESLNGFINRAIGEQMKRDKETPDK